MRIALTIQSIVLLALAAVVLKQEADLSELEERVSAIRTTTHSTTTVSSTTTRRLEQPDDEVQGTTAAVRAAAATDGTAPVQEEEFEDAVEDAVEKREARKRAEGQERWVKNNSDGLRYQLDKLAGDYGLNDQQVEAAMVYIDEILYETVDLREQLREEKITVPEAMEHGDRVLNQLRDDLNEAIGVEATDKMGDMIRPGQGWPE